MNEDEEPNRRLVLPRAELFELLRGEWVSARDGSSVDLANRLGMTRQKVSDFVSGARPCPDWVLWVLADDLGLELRLRREGVVVARRAKLPADCARIPWAFESDDVTRG